MNNEELTWQQKALTRISNQPLLAIGSLIWFADEFKLAGHLSIEDCKLLYLQLHVFDVLKMELETNTGFDHFLVLKHRWGREIMTFCCCCFFGVVVIN